MEKIITGSITKTEELLSLQNNTLENTCVAEAVYPYAFYYGSGPRKAKPNSLFLLTSKFHFLEEILNYTGNLEKCLLDQINIACAVVHWNKTQLFGIRIKNFPDYENLPTLQKCFKQQEVELLNYLPIKGLALARINKIFHLDELEQGFYLDNEEENKGYFLLNKPEGFKNFEAKIHKIRNNTNCKSFDAVPGTFLFRKTVKSMVRVFAEGLDLNLLKCLKTEFEKAHN